MWARKQLDIGWRDLVAAIGYGLRPALSSSARAEVAQGWFPEDQALVCLSVRSGFDLLLQALQLPKGSEVVLSAVTIPDMLHVLEHHGLVPVPVEVDPTLLESSVTNIEKAITSKTKLILIAHLFGSRTNMEPIAQLANQHQLLVVEDCAQTFVGKEYAGHSTSDVALFSFGPIKTATALGGAVLRVQHPELLEAMHKIQQTYEQQGHGEFLARVAKYSLLKTASFPWLYGVIEWLCRFLGLSHDRIISGLGRNFAGRSLLQNIRRRPSAALQRLLTRRIQQFDLRDNRRLRRRARIGRYLTRGIPSAKLHWTGHANASHTYWVLAACTTQAAKLVYALRQAGFDATTRSSLCNAMQYGRVPTDSGQKGWLEQTVFIPCDATMPIRELQRMRQQLRNFFGKNSSRSQTTSVN